MNKIRCALMALLASCWTVCDINGSVLISSVMADPASYDNVYEYVQFIVSERIDFSENPHTVIICNNGTILHPSGWLTGSTLTYAIQLDSGVVEQGETFYVGGPTPKLNGPNSEEMHPKNWFGVEYTVQSGAAGIGLNQQWRIGLVGNGGPSADGIAVFAGKAEDLTEESIPLDCVFYGDAVGDAAAYGYRLTDGSLLDEGTDIYPSSAKENLMKFEGVYDYINDTWVKERTATNIPSFSEGDLAPAIRLVPTVYDVKVTSQTCETCISWNSILPDTTHFTVIWRDDSIKGNELPLIYQEDSTYTLDETIELQFSTERNVCSNNPSHPQRTVLIFPMEKGRTDTLGFSLGYNTAKVPALSPETPSLRDCTKDTLLYLPIGGKKVWVELPTPHFDDPCKRYHLASTFLPDSFAPGIYEFEFTLRNDSNQAVDNCHTTISVVDTTPAFTDSIPDAPEVPEIPDTPESTDTIPTPADTIPALTDSIPDAPEVPEIPDTPESTDTIPTPADTTPAFTDSIPDAPEVPEIPDTPESTDTIPTPADTTPAFTDSIPDVPEVPELPDTPESTDTIPTPADTTPAFTDSIPDVPEVPELPDTPESTDTIPTPANTTPSFSDSIPDAPEVPELPDTPESTDTIPTPADTTPAFTDSIPDAPEVPEIPDTPESTDTIPTPSDTTPSFSDSIPDA
ncbi:MAG: hypothetical protein IKX43_04735, partial [Paludibacteraceae bacterium]|nr:hypothetical protein [Paludibacteraceae bacterium]